MVTSITQRGSRSFNVEILDLYARTMMTEVWDRDCLIAFSKTLYNKKRHIAITMSALTLLCNLLETSRAPGYVEEFEELVVEDVSQNSKKESGLVILTQSFNRIKPLGPTL